jgi:hypothetical protein
LFAKDGFDESIYLVWNHLSHLQQGIYHKNERNAEDAEHYFLIVEVQKLPKVAVQQSLDRPISGVLDPAS